MFFDLPPIDYTPPVAVIELSVKDAGEFMPEGLRLIEITNIQKEVIDRTLTLEGNSKYTNYIENGKRRPTKFGITLDTLKVIKPNATASDIKKLTRIDAIGIYKDLYWEEGQVDKFPVYLQDIAFDGMVNHGVYGMAKVIQRSLNDLGNNLKVDGVIGSATLNALKSKDEKEIRNAILNRRERLYRGLRDWHKFGTGWLNRLKAVKEPPSYIV